MSFVYVNPRQLGDIALRRARQKTNSDLVSGSLVRAIAPIKKASVLLSTQELLSAVLYG
jgi:hypothetical protein